MKKFILLPFFLLLLAACSADDSAFETNEAAAVVTVSYDKPSDIDARQGITSCFSTFTAYPSVDVSGGINNPVLRFNAVVPANIPFFSMYKLKVEVQPLADCENMSSNQGNIIVYTSSSYYINISTIRPYVAVVPSQLPSGCYKWRMVIESINARSTCMSVTSWYDSPLF